MATKNTMKSLQQRLNMAVVVLQTIEWSCLFKSEQACPFCLMTEEKGHDKSCLLNKIIQEECNAVKNTV
jgi:hypothetical protein